MAETAKAFQIGSCKICLMESSNFGGSASGLALSPKLKEK